MTPKPIPPAQAAVLTVLARHTSLTKPELASAMGVSKNTIQRVYQTLVFRELVSQSRADTRSFYNVSIKDAGRSALQLHTGIEPQYRPTAARTFTTTSLANWPTRPGPYYRNNGHAHVPSRGVSC